jgi:hypothetical protein
MSILSLTNTGDERMGFREQQHDEADEGQDFHLEQRVEAAHIVIGAVALWMTDEQLEAAMESTGGTLASSFQLAVDGIIDQLAAKNRGGIWAAAEARLARAWDAYCALDVEGLVHARRAMQHRAHDFEAGSHGERCRLCLSFRMASPHPESR